jgi:hypothetical protein
MRPKITRSAVLAMIFTVGCFIAGPAWTESRWRSINLESRWDTRTAKRTGKNIRIWWEAPVLDEQRQSLIKDIGEEFSSATSARYGIIFDCKASRYRFFNITWLKETGVPLRSTDIPEEFSTFEEIAPETNIEALKNDVCGFFK